MNGLCTIDNVYLLTPSTNYSTQLVGSYSNINGTPTWQLLSTKPTITFTSGLTYKLYNDITPQKAEYLLPATSSTNYNIVFTDTDLKVLNSANTDIFTNELYVISNASCYNEDTLILCLIDNEEKYCKIQDLRKGVLVKTLNGYKKIELIGKRQMINDPTTKFHSMYIMYKSESNNLIQDLIVTGYHYIESETDLIKMRNKKKININGKTLIVAADSVLFTKINNTDIYTYYHLVLESDNDEHFCIIANGIVSESTNRSHYYSHNFIDL